MICVQLIWREALKRELANNTGNLNTCQAQPKYLLSDGDDCNYGNDGSYDDGGEMLLTCFARVLTL